jgi:hypothetical protein
MAKKKTENVTMRIRIGQSELEVTGSSNFVEKKIAEFIELNKQNSVAMSALEQVSISRADEKSIQPSGKPMSAAQFFKKVKPHTDLDRALAAGYYLEVFKKMENFTSIEVREIIKKEAKIQPPKNTSDAINKNITKGYMMSAGDKDGKMAFVLTSDGEEAIKTLIEQ